MGYIISFGFSCDAHEEAARVVAAARGILIQPVTVADRLKEGADVVTPQPGLLIDDLPLPEPRPIEARPSVEELVASDTDLEVVSDLPENTTPAEVT
jgi:hypothetical protein